MLTLTTLLFLFLDLAASTVIDANFFMSLLSNPPNPAIIPLDLAISKHPITTIITLLDLAIDSNSKDPTVLLGLPLIILLITDLNSSRFFPFLPPHSHTHCFNPQPFLLLFFLLLLFIYCACLHFYAYYSIMILFIVMIRFLLLIIILTALLCLCFSLLRINGPVVPLPLHRVNDLTVSLPIISKLLLFATLK